MKAKIHINMGITIRSIRSVVVVAVKLGFLKDCMEGDVFEREILTRQQM
jgi:hypothetical protein